MRLFGLLRMAPWVRGPLLLLRRPGVAFALTVAALVTALPAAAAPLFLSSAREATLAHRVASDCPSLLGQRIQSGIAFERTGALLANGQTVTGRQLVGLRTAEADRAAARVPGLGPRLDTLTVSADSIGPSGSRMPIMLVARDGFGAHVRVLRGPAGPGGVWIPDSLAEQHHLGVGGTLTLAGGYDRSPGDFVELTHPVRVTAVYRDLRRLPDDPYWCASRNVYRGPPGVEFTNSVVPPMVLTDSATLLATATAADLNGTQSIEYPLRGGFDQPRAARTGRAVEAMRQRLLADQPPVFRADYVHNSRFTSTIGAFAGRAELVRHSLLPPVIPITLAGVLVGLLVVAAAGVFWTKRRRTELTALSAHGVGPAALGVKAVLEAAPALLVGAAAGWAAALGLVRWIGPSATLSAEAPGQSVLAAAAGLVATVLVLGVTAAGVCRGLADHVATHHRRRLLSWPWELVLVAAALPVWRGLGGSAELGGFGSGLGTVAQVPARLLVVPIMVIVGLAAFSARTGARWLRGGLRYAPRHPSRFLAWRRGVRDAAIATTLAAATAVPIAFAAYGATVTSSVRATMAAEARVLRGADVVLSLSRDAPVPADLAGRTTRVLRLNGVQVNGVRADMLAVDPGTFPRDAFWDARLTGSSLRDLVGRLRPRDGGTFTALGSGPVQGGTAPVTWGSFTLGTVEVDHVERLPAQQGGYPVLLALADALPPQMAHEASREWWIRGRPAEVLRDAAAANLPLSGVSVADDLYAGTTFEPLTYTFEYLVALSLLTGLIAAVGLLLYLEGRAARQRRAYVLLRRMGLRPGGHRRAMLLELALPLGVGLVGGVAVAGGLTGALGRYFEINPTAPPDTVITVPWPELGGTTGAVLLIGLLAGLYAHRRISRARPAEVLRDIA